MSSYLRRHLVPLLVDPGPLGAGLGYHGGEHILDLRHVGHDVLHEYQGYRVVHLALSLLTQDLLVTTEIKEFLF